MKYIEGWWCPPKLTAPAAYLRRAEDIDAELTRVKGRRVVIQAGGHIGIYPRYLADRFDRVYTFEPDAENFACLVRNTGDLSNVHAQRAILGEESGCVGMATHSRSSGGHSVKGAGHVLTWTIDGMGLDACDAILLDVEGYEVRALHGALKTIRRFRPLIVAEENKKQHGKGQQFGDIEACLTPLGYRVVDHVGEDLVFVC